jgi:hypothetical protein
VLGTLVFGHCSKIVSINTGLELATIYVKVFVMIYSYTLPVDVSRIPTDMSRIRTGVSRHHPYLFKRDPTDCLWSSEETK